jgi:ferredoxin-NADP reductase/uncharacterized protein YcbX
MSVSRTWVNKQGLSQDRRLMVAKPNGDMLTARTYPQLLNVKTLLIAGGLQITCLGLEPLTLTLNDFLMTPTDTEVWGAKFSAHHTTPQANEWFSRVIGEPVLLLYAGLHPNRIHPLMQQAVAFVDEYPALIISQGSLNALNNRSQRLNTMEQFRPNLVIDNMEEFAEDGWLQIKIGEVIFEVTKACERCILTTAEIGQSKFNAQAEPLASLAKFRAEPAGGIFFGQNLKPLNEGVVQVGDVVQVLKTQPKKQYTDNSTLNVALTCVARTPISKNFETFTFEHSANDVTSDATNAANSAALPSFIPGQYLPICLQVDGQSVSRCYTLSSSPNAVKGVGQYQISVKRVTGGVSSNWLHKHCKVGTQLTAQPPRGDFHLSAQHDKLLLLSAGSGITPMLSMVKYLSETNQLQDVVFYHQCSEEQDIPERAQLEQLAKQHPTLQLHIALTQPPQNWQGLTGRFDKPHLNVIPELNNRQVFVCGPHAFMAAAKNLLIKNGLPALQYHQEAFGITKADVGEYKDVNITINNQKIAATNQNTLLAHLTNNGITIKSSCLAGVCGTCKVTLKSGEVVQQSTSALTEDEKEAGVVLACCSTPITDVVVSTGEGNTGESDTLAAE